MIGSNSKPKAPQAMRRNLRQLGSDVMTLMELQTELLKVDVKEWLRACIGPLVLIGVTLLLGLASFPVLLLALAYTLELYTDLTLAASLGIAGGVGLLLAALCAFVALRWLKRDAQILSRSSVELRRNVRWLKEVLSSPTTAVGHR